MFRRRFLKELVGRRVGTSKRSGVDGRGQQTNGKNSQAFRSLQDLPFRLHPPFAATWPAERLQTRSRQTLLCCACCEELSDYRDCGTITRITRHLDVVCWLTRALCVVFVYSVNYCVLEL